MANIKGTQTAATSKRSGDRNKKMTKKKTTKPIKVDKSKLDPKCKSPRVGDKERQLVRENAVLTERLKGLNSPQISSNLQLTRATVCNILAEARKKLAAKNEQMTEQMRDNEAAEYIALIETWLPLALQPIRMTKAHEITQDGIKIVDKPVFNKAALSAFEAVLKAKAQLSRLFGLNIEQSNEKGIDESKFMVWINNTVNIAHAKSLENDLKTFDTVLRMGKLEIAPEPEQAI